MVKGETVMPIPGGDITSTETWTEVPAVTDEAIVEADAEEAVEEYIPDEVVEE
jgi:hypothetical protein